MARPPDRRHERSMPLAVQIVIALIGIYAIYWLAHTAVELINAAYLRRAMP